MKNIPVNFLAALNTENNALLREALFMMTYEEDSWFKKTVICTYSKGDEFIREQVQKNVDITDWTPLAEADISLNPENIRLVLERWQDKHLDLYSRSYSALNRAYNLTSTIGFFDDFDEMSCGINFLHAKVLIRHEMAKINKSFSYHYSHKENVAYFAFLFEKIHQITDLDTLLMFYDQYIAHSFRSYRKSLYFYSKPASIYSLHTIELITQLQNRAHELMSEQQRSVLSSYCSRLLSSNLFSTSHTQYGISPSIRNLVVDIHSSCDTPEEFVPLHELNHVEQSTLGLHDESEHILSYLLRLVISAFKDFFTLIQRVFSTVLNYFSECFSLEKQENSIFQCN